MLKFVHGPPGADAWVADMSTTTTVTCSRPPASSATRVRARADVEPVPSSQVVRTHESGDGFGSWARSFQRPSEQSTRRPADGGVKEVTRGATPAASSPRSADGVSVRMALRLGQAQCTLSTCSAPRSSSTVKLLDGVVETH